MKCFDNFQNDRICELCEISNSIEFMKCKSKHEERLSLYKKLRDIESKCPYRMSVWDEYDKFYSCDKNGKGCGKFADACFCTLECEKYIDS